MKISILIADDNQEIIDLLIPHLKKESFDVLVANDGLQAFQKFKEYSPALLLLDIMIPKIDGITLCKRIRETSKVPIIMITAKSEDEDVIMGLDIGADDYIVKPFSPKQVVARIKAVVRRLEISGENDKIIKTNNLEINMNEYIVKINGQSYPLTKKEIEILYLLVRRPNMVYSREVLLDILWGYDCYADVRAIDTHIKRIRSKLNLNDNKNNWDICTVWGVGYKFEVKDEKLFNKN